MTYPAQQYPPTFPAQPYAQPFPPQQYPPAQQPYAQPYPAQPPVQLAQGSLDDYFNQPSAGGGAALKFEAIGQSYVGIVARTVTSGDVQQQTNTQGVPQTFKDGRPKLVMKVPLQVQPSPQFPEGLAVWYVKGAARDELARAMAEAGAPAGAPEAGAALQITFTGTRQSGPGMSPAKVFQVAYQRPNGAPVAPAPVAPVAQPVTITGGEIQIQQPAPAQPAVTGNELSAEQQALLAKLTGTGPAF